MITAQVETFRGMLPELRSLLQKHYDAISLHKGRFPLEPQFFLYQQEEDQGKLLMVGLRRDGRLIGYWVALVAPGKHYVSCLTSTMDIWFIDPEYMLGKAPLILAKTVEKELRRRGVNLWQAGSKVHKPCGSFFEKIGFVKAEEIYYKWLD